MHTHELGQIRAMYRVMADRMQLPDYFCILDPKSKKQYTHKISLYDGKDLYGLCFFTLVR